MGHKLFASLLAAMLVLAGLVPTAHGQKADKAPSPPTPLSAPDAFDGRPSDFGRMKPQAYCTEQEKQDNITHAELAVKDADKAADEARAYLQQMRQRIEAERQARDTRQADADEAMLNGFETRNLERLTVTDPKLAEDQLDRVKQAPVVDCTTFERRRPVELPVEIPAIPDKICTQAEKDALVAKIDTAFNNAMANDKAWSNYLDDLQRQISYYAFTRGSRLAGAKELIAALKKEVEFARKKYDEWQAQIDSIGKLYSKASALTVSDCPPKTATGRVPTPQPMTPEPTPPKDAKFAVPARPAMVMVLSPFDLKLCTELDRNAALEAYDRAILLANANAAIANQHARELADLQQAATAANAPFDVLTAIHDEAIAYQKEVIAQADYANKLASDRAAVASRPLDPCPTESQTTPQTPPVTPPETTPPPAGGGGGKTAPCPPKKRGRKPITVGSNGKVGSGARAAKKAVGMLTGMVGGFLGGGGGGGGSDGPAIANCRIKDSEKTVFTDPGTGIALKVGAKRSGDNVVVFADVGKSPDSGTFQGAWAESPNGDLAAPARADICSMWGEWSLTVSWTRTEYVNGQMVSQTSGGYSRNGSFDLPGMVSSDGAPQGLWRQLGFSNASHGARGVALTYHLPKAALADGPVTLLVHVTRPSLNPVTTQPFVLLMSEGAKGISFAQAPVEDTDCPE